MKEVQLGLIFQKPAASYQLYRILLNSIKIRVKLSTNILDRVGGGFTCNNSVMVNYPLSHLTPSFDDFAVEIAAKGNKSSSIHFPKSGAVQCAKGEINLTKMFSPQEAKLSAQKFHGER